MIAGIISSIVTALVESAPIVQILEKLFEGFEKDGVEDASSENKTNHQLEDVKHNCIDEGNDKEDENWCGMDNTQKEYNHHHHCCYEVRA